MVRNRSEWHRAFMSSTTAKLLTVSAVALLLLSALPAQSWAKGIKHQTHSVNCSRGQTITETLQRIDEFPATLEIRGVCTENVDIDQDGVTLLSTPELGGTISAADAARNAVTIRGRKAVINGLAVTGGWNGIKVEGEATIKNAIVQNAGSNGILVQGYRAKIDNSEIRSNAGDGIAVQSGNVTIIGSRVLSNANGVGINVMFGSSARIGMSETNEYLGNTVSGNKNGIVIGFGASGLLGGNTISGNSVNGLTIRAASAVMAGKNRMTANGGVGAYIWGSHVEVSRTSLGLPDTSEFAEVISDNLGVPPNDVGIIVTDGSSVQVRGTMDISNNVGGGLTVMRNSFFRFRSPGLATINSNRPQPNGGQGWGVRLMYGSSILFETPDVTITGNAGFGITCRDQESSFAANYPMTINGNAAGDFQNCTGF